MLKKIISKFYDRSGNLRGEPITIAFLGDSVTQGCFELYKFDKDNIETVFDSENSPSYKVRQILSKLFFNVTVNIINAGISGDWAEKGLERMDKSVLEFSPDLVVVGYGLNDCGESDESVKYYGKMMKGIFEKVKKSGAECIYLTPNRMNSRMSPHLLDDPVMKGIAESCQRKQVNGWLDKIVNEGKNVAKSEGVAICDIYEIWNKLEEDGVNTTEMLANYINHPTRDMNWLTAFKIVETILL